MNILAGFIAGLGYLLGSISTAIVVCKIMRHPDPRTQGSGNPGATNVLRVGGKKAAAITLLGDMLKGLIPVLLAQFFLDDLALIALTGLAAFLGHLFPVFFGFKGGKGVATLFGVLFGFSLWVGIATVATWLVSAKLFRISSLSALLAAALAPVYVYLLIPEAVTMVIITSLMSLLLFWRHKTNIKKLLRGEEPRIGKPRHD